MSRLSGIFKMSYLSRCFPEVKNTIDLHSEWIREENYQLNKVFVAFHAVSMCQSDEV